MARLRAWFPTREFFMRSQGQVRFVRISGKLQMIAAALVATVACVWLAAMAAMLFAQFGPAEDYASSRRSRCCGSGRGGPELGRGIEK